ncbi:MAG: HAD-IIB family hydrolase [Erysipelotrichaceae bacterium]|nr:HAD-IIB family hydrolase [Erysipelotrichaceae bacterium]
MNRVFFCDIDGTILDVHRDMKHISAKTRYAFEQLKLQGDLVFIASGRNYDLLSEEIRSLNADGYVLCNGAYVRINGNAIYSCGFTKEETEAILSCAHAHHGLCIIEASDMTYVSIEDPEVYRKFVIDWKFQDHYLEEFSSYEIPYYIAMIGLPDEKEASEVEKELTQLNLIRHNHTLSFDVNVRGIDKGTGVRKAIEYLKIPYENTYCFADAMNDMGMLENVAHPIIMANAHPDLKAFGFAETDDVLNDGFYKYLVRNQLIKEG